MRVLCVQRIWWTGLPVLRLMQLIWGFISLGGGEGRGVKLLGDAANHRFTNNAWLRRRGYMPLLASTSFLARCVINYWKPVQWRQEFAHATAWKSAKTSKAFILPGPSYVLRDTGRRPDAGVKIIVLLRVTPCSLIHKYPSFRGICCLYIQNTWNMEAVRSLKEWHLSINVHGVTSPRVRILIFCSGRF
jgi:hypothetical protein